jgi:hypothetical protein
MLRIFHTIWQPFKRDIYSLLPRKSTKRKPIELTEVGSQWGKLLFGLILALCKMSFDLNQMCMIIHIKVTYTYKLSQYQACVY